MITPTPTTTSAAASGTAPRAEAATAVLSSDFDTFLKMLTAQMRNQDPLEPVNATEFTSQLATFSALEQQVLANRYLEQMAGATQTPGWAPRDVLGQEVQVSGLVDFDGTPLPLEIEASPSFEPQFVQILRADDSLAASLPLPPGQTRMVWTGAGAQGVDLGPGQYRFAVVTGEGEGAQTVGTAELVATAQELRRTDQGILARLDSGQEIPLDQITVVRSAGGAGSDI